MFSQIGLLCTRLAQSKGGGKTNFLQSDRVSAVAWLCASAGTETTGINAELTGKFPENKLN
jgi:hypothetical protein